MDKSKHRKHVKPKRVDKNKINKDCEDYGYDFVPILNEWVNIDEQKEKAKELEDM